MANQTKGRSITLYLDADNETAVQRRLFAPASRSEIINQMLRRYATLMSRSPDPGLSENEWRFLTDCLRDTWMTTHPMSSPEATLLVRTIDAVRTERHLPYAFNGNELVAKLQALSTTQAVGILDRLEGAWAAMEGSQVKVGRKAKNR